MSYPKPQIPPPVPPTPLYAPLFPIPYSSLSACLNGSGFPFPALLSTSLHPNLPIYEGAYSYLHSASSENTFES